jgi:hypothetical protein
MSTNKHRSVWWTVVETNSLLKFKCAWLRAWWLWYGECQRMLTTLNNDLWFIKTLWILLVSACVSHLCFGESFLAVHILVASQAIYQHVSKTSLPLPLGFYICHKVDRSSCGCVWTCFAYPDLYLFQRKDDESLDGVAWGSYFHSRRSKGWCPSWGAPS